MLSTILLSLALAAEPGSTPAADIQLPATQLLILTSGRKLEVRSVTISGRLALVTDKAGTVLSLRADTIDQVKTDAANEQRDAERIVAAAEAQAAEDAEAERVASIAASKASNDKLRGRHHIGSISVAGGSAAKDVEHAAYQPDKGSSASAVPAAGSGGSVASIRQRYAAVKAKVADLSKRHDAIVDQHNSTQNYVERDIDRKQLADLRQQIESAQGELPGIRAEFAAAQEAARRSGADHGEWAQPIE